MKRDLLKLNWMHLCLALFCLNLLPMAGCAWLTRPPEADPMAQQLVEALREANVGLKQYKALSRVRLEIEGRPQTITSMAIAGALPNRMRVEVLSPAGQPLNTLVADGETIHVRPHGKERIYEFQQSATALKPLLHIPVGVAQLQGVLIGRPILPEHAGAQLISQSNERIRVVLKSRWKVDLAVLEFDGSDRSLRHLELYGEQGELLYRVIWLKWREVGLYRLPDRLMIENDSGYRVTLRLRRFWPDVSLSDATFELQTPD